MAAKIDTKELGLMTHIDSPKTKDNRHRSKWRIRFDTGIDMLVPEAMFDVMVFHLEEADPKPPSAGGGHD